MGLASKLICGGLIVGAFFVGRLAYQTGLNDVYRFIDRNPQYTTKIFMYTRNKLEVTDPSFLNSLNMSTLSEKDKKEIAENYIKQKLNQAYEEGKKSIQNVSKDISNLLSDPN